MWRAFPAPYALFSNKSRSPIQNNSYLKLCFHQLWMAGLWVWCMPKILRIYALSQVVKLSQTKCLEQPEAVTFNSPEALVMFNMQIINCMAKKIGKAYEVPINWKLYGVKFSLHSRSVSIHFNADSSHILQLPIAKLSPPKVSLSEHITCRKQR